jgi:hypothetical protein
MAGRRARDSSTALSATGTKLFEVSTRVRVESDTSRQMK